MSRHNAPFVLFCGYFVPLCGYFLRMFVLTVARNPLPCLTHPTRGQLSGSLPLAKAFESC
jgi:hypothetical protein